MKKRFPIWACLAVFPIASVGTVSSADKESGKKIYDAKCAACHGKDGKGNAGLAKAMKLDAKKLDLLGAPAESDAELAQATKNGRGKMPAFKDKLKSLEIDDIVAYVRSLAPAVGKESAVQGEPAAPAAPAAGSASADLGSARKTYAAKCASCHGKEGKGNAALAKGLKLDPKSLDMTSEGTAKKSDGELIGVVKKGEGKMPGYAGKMPDKDIGDLIRLLREFAGAPENK
ncbi:MAG: c-type cytochrome [Elusimicrobiota bacterium]|jgi:cytochrome c6